MCEGRHFFRAQGYSLISVMVNPALIVPLTNMSHATVKCELVYFVYSIPNWPKSLNQIYLWHHNFLSKIQLLLMGFSDSQKPQAFFHQTWLFWKDWQNKESINSGIKRFSGVSIVSVWERTRERERTKTKMKVWKKQRCQVFEIVWSQFY